MNKKRTFVLVNIFAPLVIGAIIYYLISPDVIFVKIIDLFVYKSIRLDILDTNLRIIRFMRNYLLDMLWGYALIFVLFLIYDNNTAELMRVFIIAAGFSVIMEVLQLTPICDGTFDVLDIVLEFLAELVAVFIINIKCVRGTKNEKEI